MYGKFGLWGEKRVLHYYHSLSVFPQRDSICFVMCGCSALPQPNFGRLLLGRSTKTQLWVSQKQLQEVHTEVLPASAWLYNVPVHEQCQELFGGAQGKGFLHAFWKPEVFCLENERAVFSPFHLLLTTFLVRLWLLQGCPSALTQVLVRCAWCSEGSIGCNQTWDAVERESQPVITGMGMSGCPHQSRRGSALHSFSQGLGTSMGKAHTQLARRDLGTTQCSRMLWQKWQQAWLCCSCPAAALPWPEPCPENPCSRLQLPLSASQIHSLPSSFNSFPSCQVHWLQPDVKVNFNK